MQKQTINTELRKAQMVANKASRICMYPNCKNPAIGSHLLQKNGILDLIAKDSHIYAFKPLPFGEEGWDIVREGLNKAFTFLGFCEHHDNNLFASIEKEGFDPELYQSGLLLSYRAMCNERRKKEVIADARERFLRIKNIEKTAGNKVVSEIRDEIYGLKLGMKDNLHYEKYFVKNILDTSDEEFVFITRKIPVTEICISGVYTFETSEQLLQLNISEENYQYPSEIYINCFPYHDESILILGYHKSVLNDCKQYIKEFIDQNENDLYASLSQLMVYEVETWSCSEDFFKVKVEPRLDKIKILSKAQFFNHNERIAPELNLFN